MADRNVITDSLKGELESFIRYSWASVAAVATFLLYMLAKGCSECELQRLPSVDVFGIKIEEGQLIFAVLLVPVVQIFQLRPLQSIADFITHHRDSLDTGKLVLITAPSVLNPFHIAGGKAGTYIDWMSWAVCSITITFYPSISISILLITFTGDSFAWDYSILKKAIYTLIVTCLFSLQLRALIKIWKEFLSNREALIRTLLVAFVFVSLPIFLISVYD